MSGLWASGFGLRGSKFLPAVLPFFIASYLMDCNWAYGAEPLPHEVEAARASLSPRTEYATSDSDGVYGRLDGDFDVGLRVGAEYENAVSPAVGASLLYYWTIGAFVDQVVDFADKPNRTTRTAVGLELRPLFLPRWDADLQQGPAFLDLTLDSLSLGVAAHVPHETGASAGPQLSLAFGLPLLSRASGPWLEFRGVYRFPHSTENGPALFAFIAWHALWNSGLHRDRPLSGPSD